MPFGPKLLKSLKPTKVKRRPATLGDHLLKRRVTLGLRQKEVAKTIGVSSWTYLLWEQDKTKPEIRYWPKIISFLGVDPSPPPTTLGEKLKAYRRRRGLSQAKLASQLGVDATSLWEWENDLSKPMATSLSKLSLIIT